LYKRIANFDIENKNMYPGPMYATKNYIFNATENQVKLDLSGESRANTTPMKNSEVRS
jgi:hypothetical protein